MPTRFVTAAAVALGLVCPASADTNVTVRRAAEAPLVADDRPTPDAVRFGEVSRGRIVKSNVTQTRVTLEVAGSTRIGNAVDIPLALAAGTRVTGMTITIDKETVRAELMSAARGHSTYFDLVRRAVDPALLEHTMSTATSEQFALRVFPVTDTEHAIVTIELGPGDGPAVDDEQSLYATGNAMLHGHVVPVVTIGCGGWHQSRDIDKSIIRRHVKLRMNRLASCYQRELLGHPTLAGTAQLHFTIRPSGRVEDISVDGSLQSEAVHDCLVDELTTWSFSPTDGSTQVNYPLTFVIAGT
jgi:TonB family protein